MTDKYTIKKVPRPAHTRRLRSRGKPRLWLIHATRGHTTLELQDDATLNHFTYAEDKGGWGSTADVLISADDDFIYEFGDIMREHSSWSAGYGALGSRYEYGADEWTISIELAQTHKAEPFTAHVIDKLVWYVQKRSKDFDLDIPAVHITEWSQRTISPVPTGFIGHDETANGRKTGKSDPGVQFPWDEFLRRVEGGAVEIPNLGMTDRTNLESLLGIPGVGKWKVGEKKKGATVTLEATATEVLPGGTQARDTFTIQRVRKVQ